MAEWLAIDWDDQTVTGVEGQAATNGVRVAKTFQHTWSREGDDKGSAQTDGGELATALKSAKVSAKKLIACIPREHVIMRRLELPAVPDDELPPMVRLQAATKLASSVDQYHLDYLPLPHPAYGGKEVLVCVIPKKRIDRIRQTAETAGLALHAVGVSNIATAALTAAAASPAIPEDGMSLILARHGFRAELTLLSHGQIVFMHSAPLSYEDGDIDKLLLAEVSRTLLAQSSALPSSDISQGYVIGSESENQILAAALAERISCPVSVVDPTAAKVVSGGDWSGERSSYAGPLGMLWQSANTAVPAIDFLNPRKPTEKKDRTKLRWAIAAGAAVLIGGGSMYASKTMQADLDRQIESQRDTLRKHNKKIKDNQPLLQAGATVDQWERESRNSLESLTQLNQYLPGSQRLFLTDIEFEPARGKIAASLTASGFANSRVEVQDFYQRLDDAGYRVQPKPITPSRRYGNYPYAFELEATLPGKATEGSATARSDRKSSEAT